jgi:hypothetical protein
VGENHLIVVPALTQSEYAAKYGRDPGYKACSRQADHSTTTGIGLLVIYFAGQRLTKSWMIFDPRPVRG